MYVDNKSLTACLAKWSGECRKCNSAGKPNPPLPDLVGESAMLIAKRLTAKDNFQRYTYREDLISQGLICVVKYAHNFNPERTTNAFAYLTTVLHNAILAAISKEKEYAYTKARLLKESGIVNSMKIDLRESTEELIADFEARMSKKKKTKELVSC